MIDIVKLKTFVIVAELGSFSKASEILYITQPAVTQQIKSLEKIIGARLFKREGGKMVLTEEGKRIHEMARSLLVSYEGLVEEITKIKKDIRDTLFIGVSASFSEYKIPELLTSFHKQLPSITIKVFVGNSNQIEDALSSGIINMGIVEKEPSSKFSSIAWLRDDIVFFTYPEAPIAKRGEIEPEELYDIDLIMREGNSEARRVIKVALEKLGLSCDKLNVKIETNCIRTILNMVRSGYGASFLSKGIVERHVEKGDIAPVKIRGFDAKRNFYIIYPKENNISFLANQFIKYILSITSNDIALHKAQI